MIVSNAETLSALEVGVLCNNAVVTTGSEPMGSATEKAILQAVQKLEMLEDFQAPYRRLSEVPFSGTTKIMSVECQRTDGTVTHFVKGAPECLFKLCSNIRMDGKCVPVDEQHDQPMIHALTRLATRGLRVIAVARGPDMDNLEFAGLVGLRDPPRPGVKDSIQVLKNSKVQVCMITGDFEETAKTICSMLGITSENKNMMSGWELEEMTDEQLKKVADNVYCYYRTGPTHKARIISALQANGHTVCMTGDGVNDSVAMKRADVGVCMGITGTDVCKEAADMILLDDDFSTILSAIEEGKCIFYNIRNFVRFQLSTSIAALMLISFATLCDIPNPLNAMQILWINIIMDGPPAQSLGLEPVDDEVVKRPPRGRDEQGRNSPIFRNYS
jgi:Ca2+-transporting ATPase